MHRIIKTWLFFLMLMAFCMRSTALSVDYQQGNSSVVIINEIHYDPDVKTELVEFVELHNFGSADIDLSNWYFSDGISYAFPIHSTLPANGYVILAQNTAHIHDKWGSQIRSAAIFGPFELDSKLDNSGERLVLCNAQGDEIDQVEYKLGFPWPTVGDAVPDDRPGTGHSIQLVNSLFDNNLGGGWRSAYPTPAAANSDIYAENIPPHIRQVKHVPRQPKSGEIVTITAKVTDSDVIIATVLNYQVVEPGSYININDAQYNTDWVSIAMRDDGLDGDKTANDDIYTVQMPASVQVHRRLIRYRISTIDSTGNSVTVPYADDTQPNFAYFVYDGVPAWSGADRPGVTDVVEYSTEVMRSLPVYHLLAKEQDVLDSQFLPGARAGQYWGSDYPWHGTLVYDGVVYDHIRFRARGGVWRYSMGKNMWKFDFNRGHYFQARDDYGQKYDTTWDKLNFSACIQQGDYRHRGEQGMFEAAGFKLFNLVGVEAPKTNWLHFRVIDDADEFGSTQFDGDFWGLYMTIEQMDGRFLDEHNLPDGNLYKIEGFNGDLNNQGPTAVTDKSDLHTFMSTPGINERWWRENVNLDSYYSYRCVVEGIHHGDIGYGKNYFFYLNPETNVWSMLPWDIDLTWAENMYGNGEDPFKSQGAIFSNPALLVEYQNRLREFQDLLYNTDQMSQLIDELASIINDPAGGLSIVDADRARWDYNPIMVSGNVLESKAGYGRFYRQVDTRDFEGMVRLMKDYVVYVTNNTRNWYGRSGPSMNSLAADSLIPSTPIVTATGPAGFPANALTFETSPFSDPQGGGTFAAMKWRIAEVSPGSQIVVPQELEDTGDVLIPERAYWRYFKGTREPSQEPDEWRRKDFDDSDWLAGATPMGYGESFIETELSDMRGRYSTVYLRKTFNVESLDDIENLQLEAMYDDGVNVWINGVHVVSGNTPSANMPFDSVVDNRQEDHGFSSFRLSDWGDYLDAGTNVIAAQVINAYLSDSSDCFVDIRLINKPAGPGESPSTPRNYGSKAGIYEINAVWESEELANFDSDIQIPASVIEVGSTYRVRCRMKDNTGRWSHWSTPVQFEAGEPVSAGVLNDLRITEVMYNPSDADIANGELDVDNDDFEFVELKNIGDENLDLSYVSFVNGITFDFADSGNISLGPGEFILVVSNEDAFESRYGTNLPIAGEYTGKLSNSGENISLVDFWNGTIAQFDYNDGRGWPLSPDGGGHSLVPLNSALLIEPDGSLDYGGNWRASSYLGGSPGRDDPAPVADIVLNEIMANTDYSDSAFPGHESNDWIELYNTTGTSVNLHNWYLSDDIDELKKWAIPAVDIAGYGWISFDEISGFHDSADSGFGLNKAGEEVILSYLPGGFEDRVVDYVRFKGQDSDMSLGRYPDGDAYWLAMEPSRDLANAEPLLHVVIDELMYHPADANEEYIELYNPTAARVFLEDDAGAWRLDGGVNYTFPPGTSIDAGGRLIVVGFDPSVETSRLDSFIASYNAGSLTSGVDIVGPWSGNLSNSSERVALERPLEPEQADQSVSWMIVDEVIYADVSPWPEDADGSGAVLQRVFSDQYHSGNDFANWQAASPTPGSGQ